MTVDWFVLLTPLVLLVVALPLLFVGCASFKAAEGEPPKPPEEPAPTPPTGSGPTPPPPPPPPPPKTGFRLEMDPNLQDGLASKVIRIDVQWVLESATGPAPPLFLPDTGPVVIVSQQIPLPVPPAIDPAKDKGASFEILSANIGARDRVRCVPVVRLENGNTPTVAGTTVQAALVRDAVHEFRIKSRRPQMGGFLVYFNGT